LRDNQDNKRQVIKVTQLAGSSISGSEKDDVMPQEQDENHVNSSMGKIINIQLSSPNKKRLSEPLKIRDFEFQRNSM